MDRKKNVVTLEQLERDLSAIPGMPGAIEAERANLLAAQFVEYTRKAARLSQEPLREAGCNPGARIANGKWSGNLWAFDYLA